MIEVNTVTTRGPGIFGAYRLMSKRITDVTRPFTEANHLAFGRFLAIEMRYKIESSFFTADIPKNPSIVVADIMNAEAVIYPKMTQGLMTLTRLGPRRRAPKSRENIPVMSVVIKTKLVYLSVNGSAKDDNEETITRELIATIPTDSCLEVPNNE